MDDKIQGGQPFYTPLTPEQKDLLQQIFKELGKMSDNNNDDMNYFFNNQDEKLKDIFQVIDPNKNIDQHTRAILKHRMFWDNTLFRAKMFMRDYRAEQADEAGIYTQDQKQIHIQGTTENTENSHFWIEHSDGTNFLSTIRLRGQQESTSYPSGLSIDSNSKNPTATLTLDLFTEEGGVADQSSSIKRSSLVGVVFFDFKLNEDMYIDYLSNGSPLILIPRPVVSKAFQIDIPHNQTPNANFFLETSGYIDASSGNMMLILKQVKSNEQE